MENGSCAFFLGANSGNGFFSLTESLRGDRGLSRIYAVKGGPGSGKSTVLRALGDALDDGARREELRCSSDPGSLDGVVLHGRGVAVLDGTAPHVLEPDFPGAAGDYLAMPPPRGGRALREQYPALCALRALSRHNYAAAYRLLHAARLLDDHIRALLSSPEAEERLAARADGILRRELPRRVGPGAQRLRFLDGITPAGPVFLRETAERLCRRVYVIEDGCGLARALLERLRDGALARGYEVYVCLSPLDPSRVLHLLLPEASLAFVTEDGSRLPGVTPARRVRADACAVPEDRAARGRARALRRLRDGLLRDAVSELAAAHRQHDRMEEIYRPHMDFAAQEELIAAFARRIAEE